MGAPVALRGEGEDRRSGGTTKARKHEKEEG